MDLNNLLLLLILFILFICSAFFSAAETAMISINRYRLKHLAKISKSAQRVEDLLKHPDKFLGMVLLGNTFLNICAGSVATVVAVDLFGEKWGVVISSVLITFFILVFAEVSPKTVAVLYPEKIALPSSFFLTLILKLFYPVIWIINLISNGILRLFGISATPSEETSFNSEELRAIVHETTGRIPSKHRNMLLSILDLEKVTVDDIMIPRNEIIGIDLDNEWHAIVAQLASTQHTFLPVYHQDLNNTIGFIHAKRALPLMSDENFNEEKLRQSLDEPLFVPEGTSLTKQMVNFQQVKKRFALVVDEYGDILGLVTLEDILEEIVGEFTTNVPSAYPSIVAQEDGSYLVEGGIAIREFNRLTHWQLPIDGPKTLNGLLLDYLQMIPEVGTCCLINRVPFEVVQVQDNRIKTLKVFPPLQENPEASAG